MEELQVFHYKVQQIGDTFSEGKKAKTNNILCMWGKILRFTKEST